MANLKDIVLFLSIVVASGIMLFGTGVIDSNILDNIVSNPSVTPEDKYKLTSEVTANTDGIADNSFKYKTEKASSFLSVTGNGFSLSFVGAKNVEMEYVLKNSDSQVVASGSKRLGDIGAFQSKSVSFETNNLVSGEYSVEYVAKYEKCGLIGCSDQTDSLRKTVEVPKLPLGEY